jgi:hypothetical protein
MVHFFSIVQYSLYFLSFYSTWGPVVWVYYSYLQGVHTLQSDIFNKYSIPDIHTLDFISDESWIHVLILFGPRIVLVHFFFVQFIVQVGN